MVRHRIPQVIDDQLNLLNDTDGPPCAILVGSAAWYTWLNDTAVQSFAFRSDQGTLTARRERQHGYWYWYAYRTQHGYLHKAYLGKSEELTHLRLHEVAATLVTDRVAQHQKLDATSPTSIAIPGPVPRLSSATRVKSYKQTLLATKLFIPPPAPTLVARPRLIAQITASVRRALTLVTAPAGWGKTTLLSAWYADSSSSGYTVAWVSLDAGDNDPTRFWTYVMTALNTLHPEVGKTTLALLHLPQPPSMESVLTTLLNEVAVLPVETVLVLDDYYVIEALPIHQALAFLLEHLPPWLHLIISTRVDPLLPLGRLRVRGALTEVRASDLRFTFEETAAFFREVMELPLSSEKIAALETLTEGWIAGLQLAALSAQGRPVGQLEQFVDAFTGSNRYVVEYLAEEVLGKQSDEMQTFLLYTSILDCMSAPLCDALLTIKQREADPDPVQHADVLLEHLQRANLFLTPLDEEGRWYRYHHLFAAVLRSRLKQVKPKLVPELHRRASSWYEQHGLLTEAVQHALAAPDFECAARLIEQVGLPVGILEQIHTVLGWLKRLPDALLRARPTLCIDHAVTLMFTNQLEAAEARLQDAERCLQNDVPADHTCAILGQIVTVRGNMARFSGDLARCVTLSQQGLDLLPETEVIFRASAIVNVDHAYLVSGDVTPAMERLAAEATAPIRASGNLSATLRSFTNLARRQVLQGRLHQAVATYREAVQMASGPGGVQILIDSPGYSFGLGDVLREWNDLDAAERHLMQGMEEIKGTLTVDAEVITQGHIALAHLQQAQGDYISALATLDEFVQVARQRSFVSHLFERGAAAQAQIELAQGNLATASRWAGASSLFVDGDFSYPQEGQYLTLVRVRIAQGRNDPAAPFLRDALVLLDRLLHDAQGKARVHSVIEILVLRALALDAQGDQSGALTTLERALILAEPEGYFRIFVNEGEPMLLLLSKLQATHRDASGYLQTLLIAGGLHEHEPPATPLIASRAAPTRSLQPLLDPLSERELEVLHLLASGASNYEIAEHLVVAVSTVKRHVSNIFSKLAVTNRTQAVARARELGLL